MFCPYCGNEEVKPSTYCTSCGKRIDSFSQMFDRIEGETRVIETVAPSDADETRVIMAGEPSEAKERDPQDIPSRTANIEPLEFDFSGLEVMAGAATGYIPQLDPSSTEVMPIIDEQLASSPRAVSAKPAEDQKKPKRGGVIALVIVLLIAIGAAIGGYLWYASEQDAKEKAHSLHAVALSIEAPGFTDNATGIPVMAEGTDLDGNAVSETFYLNAAGEGVELMRGDYKLTFPASPLGPAGEIWNVPTGAIEISIPDTIEPSAPFEGAKNTKVAFTPIAPIDVTIDMINRAYEYAKNDPNHSGVAASYRNEAIDAHEDAVAAAAAAAEAARIAAEEEAARAAAEEARKNASPDGYYGFTYATQVATTSQDEFGYWRIEPKGKGEIRKADSINGLEKGKKVSAVVFLVPDSGVTYQSSGGTAGVQTLPEADGREYFLRFLNQNSAEGLYLILHISNGQVDFVRICS